MSFKEFLNQEADDDRYGPDSHKVRLYLKGFNTNDCLNLTMYNINILVPLPDGVTNLIIGNEHLVYISKDAIPDSLVSFTCRNSPNLRRLPDMPSGLKKLAVTHVPITKIPKLPIGIESIQASCTDITALPPLYAGIINITVPGSKLKKLPFKHMPSTLKNLDIAGTNVKVLHSLGRGLTHLNISNTKIKVLPPLPYGLINLFCVNCDLVVPTGELELGASLEGIRDYGLRWLDWHYLAWEKERSVQRCDRIKHELVLATCKSSSIDSFID
jgi:hypothetical protein